ncbi:protein Mis18-beta isoform X2 [Heteronotia binoei]|uniref:protein Mis18-beta isoform X2 n=1 Tax=Heteronotia binoei TaxID=13085 RepID=UPI0029302B3B|nr:protein Mis18-beta isoform X2 [Heteronotia binoei]
MAVRRQLQRYFQEPRVGGAIMVERPRPATRNWHQEQERRKALDNASSVLKDRSHRLEECMMFQCQRCRTVLGDSLSLCAQEENLIACFKVTNDVIVEDSVMVCIEGDFMGCYMLKTKTTVKASKITFPTVSLKERVQKLKENLVLVHTHIQAQHKKLEERSQQKIAAKKHCYKLRPYTLASGHQKKLNK